MEFVRCGQGEMDYLISRDPVLGAAILRMGKIEREAHPAPFVSLVRSMVGQLISRKAADTVYARLESLVMGEVTPQSLFALSQEEIKGCGMSLRKAQNILNLAKKTRSGELDFEALAHLEDGEVIRQLSALPGVGVWTAEMLLLFSMGRKNILSYSDLGIRNGMSYLYHLEKLGKKEFEEYRKRYSPCGSVASLYLWELWAECQQARRQG